MPLFRMKPIPGVDGERFVGRLRRDKESLGLASLPKIFQMAVAAGPFIAKIAGVNAITSTADSWRVPALRRR